jgi:hypothetical protein
MRRQAVAINGGRPAIGTLVTFRNTAQNQSFLGAIQLDATRADR